MSDNMIRIRWRFYKKDPTKDWHYTKHFTRLPFGLYFRKY